MQIFFAKISDNIALLHPDEARHASKVLRKKLGDKIQVLDGSGSLFHCQIIEIQRDKLAAKVLSVDENFGSVPYDLSIAIALLAANGTIPNETHADTVFLGELALDGAIRSIRGVLPSLMAAYSAGVLTAVVPLENLAEAELMTHMKIIGM